MPATEVDRPELWPGRVSDDQAADLGVMRQYQSPVGTPPYVNLDERYNFTGCPETRQSIVREPGWPAAMTGCFQTL